MNKNNKPIVAYYYPIKKYKEYPSIKAAADALDIGGTQISACAKKKIKYVKKINMTFRFKKRQLSAETKEKMRIANKKRVYGRYVKDVNIKDYMKKRRKMLDMQEIQKRILYHNYYEINT